MKMKTVIWQDDECIVPNYGVAQPKKEITLPEELADGFIKQKRATALKEVKSND